MDGVEATGLPWAPGNDGVGATNAVLTDQAFFKEATATAESYGICQSTPLGKGKTFNQEIQNGDLPIDSLFEHPLFLKKNEL